MPRLIKFAAVLGLIAFLASTWAIIRLTQARASGHDDGRGTSPSSSGIDTSDLPAPPGAPILSIPEFSLIDQNGEPFTRENLRGRITIVNFVFTHCPFVCPTLMEKMEGLSIALKNEPVHFLSISVDPAHDTPAALREFAKLHNADPARWTFLTGDKADIDRLITDGMKFALTPDTANPITLPDGSTMDNIIHPSWFVLLGPDVVVKSLYRPSDAQNMEVLANDVRRMAKDLPAQPAGTR